MVSPALLKEKQEAEALALYSPTGGAPTSFLSLSLSYPGHLNSQVKGPVYVKYNSGTRTFAEVRANNGVAWRPGDAFLSPYDDGCYRGVGFVPNLADGEPRQFAYLPLDLF